MKEESYAHSREGKPPEEWHRLEDHLKAVVEMARMFADDFHAGDWGYLAGVWHDLEKCSPSFQEMLSRTNEENSKNSWEVGETIHV